MKLFKLMMISFLCVCIAFAAACSSNDGGDVLKTQEYTESEAGSDAEVYEHKRVCFEVENFGEFVVETYPEYAPETVAHFLRLVEEEFYNGFTIDEIIPGFKLQTSEVSSETKEEYMETVTGEFFKNGITNELKLTKGVLAMQYPSGEFNAARAQFMIMLGDTHGLDGWYGGFASVIDGMDVVDEIAAAQRDTNNVPVSPIVMKKVYIKE